MLLLQFLSLFEKEGIGHLVSGGYALCFNGAVRPTVDIDFLIPLSVKNSESYQLLIEGLSVLGFHQEPKTSTSTKCFFSNKNGESLCLHFDSNFLKYRTKTVRIQSYQFDILHPKDLIEIKSKNPSPQNTQDILALRGLYG